MESPGGSATSISFSGELEVLVAVVVAPPPKNDIVNASWGQQGRFEESWERA